MASQPQDIERLLTEAEDLGVSDNLADALQRCELAIRSAQQLGEPAPWRAARSCRGAACTWSAAAAVAKPCHPSPLTPHPSPLPLRPRHLPPVIPLTQAGPLVVLALALTQSQFHLGMRALEVHGNRYQR